MKCWKCGEENAEGRKKCAGCGTNLNRAQPETAIGQGLRLLYDRYGAQAVFSNSLLLVNGIGDVVQEVYANELRKFKNHLKTVLDAGIGRMYLEQLSAGAPDSGFYERVKTGLTEDADLSEKAADEMMGYFDEMIGWQCGPELPDNSPFDPVSDYDQIYEQASRLIETGRLSGYQEAEHLLKEIPHWRDADRLLSVCRQRIRDLGPSPDPNPSKNKLWLWVVLTLVAAAAIGLFAYRGGQERERTAVTQTAQMAFLQATQTATAAERSLKVGDIITFGHYEQDNNTVNGAEAINWQVLAVENGRALVISRYALDAKPYNEDLVDVTWETCTLRSWLNGEFYNSAFTSSERAQILQVTLQNPDNPARGTEGGNNTTDRIFLLSIDEVNKFFSGDTTRQCKATVYAKANGVLVNSDIGYSWWWLRSPGFDSNTAADVYANGSISSDGIVVSVTSDAVRPAFWLDL